MFRLVLEEAVLRPKDTFLAKVTASGEGVERIGVDLLAGDGRPLYGDSRPVQRCSGCDVSEVFELRAPPEPGRYRVQAWAAAEGGVKMAVENAEILVAGEAGDVALVFHQHQAPNYCPDRSYHHTWAFDHLYSDELKPQYEGGPYFFHIHMHLKHPGVRATHNWSPSLLRQWLEVAEKGEIRVRDGSCEAPCRRVRMGETAARARWVIRRIRHLASSGRMEVLSSIYAHTVAGFLTLRWGMVRLVEKQVEEGLRTTEEVLGIRPRGFWVPEMSFSEDLARILADQGVRYIVLSERHHYRDARGEKRGVYRPHVHEPTGIIVLFRDDEISDMISFRNNFSSEAEADRAARSTVIRIAEKLAASGGGVLTIALDGENFMVFAENPGLAAYFLDRLYTYLENAQERGVLRTVLLSEAAARAGGRLVFIPPRSWLGPYVKWYGEREGQVGLWRRLAACYRRLMLYRSVLGEDEVYAKCMRFVAHAADSDYWWAEFFAPSIVETWVREANRLLSSAAGVYLGEYWVEERESGLLLGVRLINRSKLDIRLRARLLQRAGHGTTAVEVPHRSSATVLLPAATGPSTLIIEANGEVLEKIHVSVKPGVRGGGGGCAP